MKNLIIPIDHLVMLAELDDKETGQMAKAIAQYANKGIAPSFSNSALKAIFTLFRSNIEAQRESSAKRSEINTTNAMSKKSATKKKVVKKVTSTENESQQIADDATEASIIRKTKCSRKTRRSVLFHKTKCSFLRFPSHTKKPRKICIYRGFFVWENLLNSRIFRTFVSVKLMLCVLTH